MSINFTEIYIYINIYLNQGVYMVNLLNWNLNNADVLNNYTEYYICLKHSQRMQHWITSLKMSLRLHVINCSFNIWFIH